MKPLTLGAGHLNFFRLLYAIAKIAFIPAKVIASLDFISAVHICFISYTISSLIHSSRDH